MNSMRLPGFSADRSLLSRNSCHAMPSNARAAEASNEIVPAVPMGYCKTVCGYRVCGSSLPGYPPPMCYECWQECWIHDSGSYFISV
jgi:hypothetical protein